MKILAIDFNSLMNRSFYAIRHLSNREGFETNALFGFTKTYLKLLADVYKRQVVPRSMPMIAIYLLSFKDELPK